MRPNFVCILIQIIHLAVVLLASYIFAAYVEPIIYISGFLPVETGKTFWANFTVMSVFCLAQLLFRALVQFLFAAPLIWTSVVDMFSFLPCLILIGGISGYFPQQLPHIPPRLVPFIFLCLFFATHFLFKLVTLFTATYGKPGSRWSFVYWFLPILIFAYISVMGSIRWKNELIQNRFFQVKVPVPVLDKGNQTFATEIPEASFSIQTFPLSSEDNCYWLIHAGNKFSSTSQIYLYFIPSDKDISPICIPVEVSPDTWTEMCFQNYLPECPTNFVLTWSSYRLPAFLAREGLIPQFSLKSLEEFHKFFFTEEIESSKMFKSIYIDGPYCEKQAMGEVIVRQENLRDSPKHQSTP